MMTEQKTQLIRSYVARRLGWLQTQAEHPQKAILANLGWDMPQAIYQSCGGRYCRIFHWNWRARMVSLPAPSGPRI